MEQHISLRKLICADLKYYHEIHSGKNQLPNTFYMYIGFFRHEL
ncbi:uncharacterized protein METZ01_LOCUS312241 [marine metagenome]|uniref:Uncharacterized protein n=1 Tax=marine metagenome TaxID=408172 RepID=A0A382NGM5_9ZZZZ